MIVRFVSFVGLCVRRFFEDKRDDGSRAVVYPVIASHDVVEARAKKMLTKHFASRAERDSL